MQPVKQACTPVLAMLCVHSNQYRQDWNRARPLLNKDTVLEMMEAVFVVGDELLDFAVSSLRTRSITA